MTRRRIFLLMINGSLIAGLWMHALGKAPAPKSDPLITRTVPQVYSPLELPEREQPQFTRSPLGQRSDRRDPLPEVDETSLDVRLVGAVLLEAQRSALIEQDGIVQRVEEGQELGGWYVARISSRSIEFVQREKRIEVLLDAAPETRPDAR